MQTGMPVEYARHHLGRGHVGETPQLPDNTLRCQTSLHEPCREFPARQYVEQLGQQRRAAAQFKCLSSCTIEQAARRATWRDHTRHQRIRIQHHPHGQAGRAARSWRAA